MPVGSNLLPVGSSLRWGGKNRLPVGSSLVPVGSNLLPVGNDFPWMGSRRPPVGRWGRRVNRKEGSVGSEVGGMGRSRPWEGRCRKRAGRHRWGEENKLAVPGSLTFPASNDLCLRFRNHYHLSHTRSAFLRAVGLCVPKSPPTVKPLVPAGGRSKFWAGSRRSARRAFCSATKRTNRAHAVRPDLSRKEAVGERLFLGRARCPHRAAKLPGRWSVALIRGAVSLSRSAIQRGR